MPGKAHVILARIRPMLLVHRCSQRSGRSSCDCIVTFNNIAQQWQDWSSDLCSLCRFAFCLWFTQPIIALVIVNHSRDSRQDSEFNQGSVQ